MSRLSPFLQPFIEFPWRVEMQLKSIFEIYLWVAFGCRWKNVFNLRKQIVKNKSKTTRMAHLEYVAVLQFLSREQRKDFQVLTRWTIIGSVFRYNSHFRHMLNNRKHSIIVHLSNWKSLVSRLCFRTYTGKLTR